MDCIETMVSEYSEGLVNQTLRGEKKRIIQIFKRHGLDITIKANLKIAQYLDVE